MDEVKYKIRVSTSDVPNSGLIGNVYVQVLGRKGELNEDLKTSANDDWSTHLEKKRKDKRDLIVVKFPLENSLNNTMKFRPGNVDKFITTFRDFDNIEKIRVSHDSLSNWHLKKISIKNLNNDLKWIFKCNKKIGKLNGNVPFDLFPVLDVEYLESSDDEPQRKNLDRNNPKLTKINYQLKIKTSDFSKPAEGNVDLILFGHLCSSQIVKLNSRPSDKKQDKFLNGSLDLFKFEETDVGNIFKIHIICAIGEQKKLSDWFFDEIVLDIPSKCLRHFFGRNSRTVVIKEKNQTILELYPRTVKKTLKQQTYKIDIFTKKMRNREEFLKSVSLNIMGDFGSSGEFQVKQFCNEICLQNEDVLNDKFHFHHKMSDLGEIYKIKLRQIFAKNESGTVTSKDWHLLRINVSFNTDEFNFPFSKWIRVDKEKESVDLKLYEEFYLKRRKEFFDKYKYPRTLSTLTVKQQGAVKMSKTPSPVEYAESFESDNSDDEKFLKKDQVKSKSPEYRKSPSIDRRPRSRESLDKLSRSRSISGSSSEIKSISESFERSMDSRSWERSPEIRKSPLKKEIKIKDDLDRNSRLSIETESKNSNLDRRFFKERREDSLSPPLKIKSPMEKNAPKTLKDALFQEERFDKMRHLNRMNFNQKSLDNIEEEAEKRVTPKQRKQNDFENLLNWNEANLGFSNKQNKMDGWKQNHHQNVDQNFLANRKLSRIDESEKGGQALERLSRRESPKFPGREVNKQKDFFDFDKPIQHAKSNNNMKLNLNSEKFDPDRPIRSSYASQMNNSKKDIFNDPLAGFNDRMNLRLKI